MVLNDKHPILRQTMTSDGGATGDPRWEKSADDLSFALKCPFTSQALPVQPT